MGAIRVKDGHFARKYRRIKARSGHKIAIGAIKHAILIAQLEKLGHSVTLQTATTQAGVAP